MSTKARKPKQRTEHFIKVTPGLGCWWFYKKGSFNESMRYKGRLTVAQSRDIRDLCEVIYEMGKNDAREEMREALGL